MLAVLALACADRGPAAEAVAERCGMYVGQPDIYGFCITSLAGGLPDVQVCTRAGRWEEHCHTVWVEARLHPDSGVSTDELLKSCRNADCRLDVLDFRADADLLTQVERCGQWAAENAPHCVSHAVQRWRAQRPSAADLATVSSWEGILADWLGHHLAEAVVCDRVGSCSGSPAVMQACQRAADALRSGQSECHHPSNAPRPIGRP